ncbi:MAG: ATP-binding cassette domain-containing protein [bacterium]|nr:ATP-binding cassette domain-containing protein [bacterium]
MIELIGIAKYYGKTKILSDISLSIAPGEFVCITGPSGAGKSTLLHLLTGAEEATKGTIEIDGVDLRIVPPRALQIFRQKLGIVFQDYKLLKNRTVAENIAFPLEVCDVPDADIDIAVRQVLTIIDMTKHAHTLPNVLSGGEKARTAIGRAIAHDPLIILADEPTGNVDPQQSALIMNLFKKINESGATVIIATHDAGLVDALQTRVIELRDGSITRDSKGGYAKENFIKNVTAKLSSNTKKVKITAISS